ncbi:unnamed protein product [Sphagnum jensenii]
MEWLEKKAERKALSAARKAALTPEPVKAQNLTEKLVLLSSKLRAKGFSKVADELEGTFLHYRKNVGDVEDALYHTNPETGDDLLEAAHPDGDVEVAVAKDHQGDVETLPSEHEKIVHIVEMNPSRKAMVMAMLRKSLNVKVADALSTAVSLNDTNLMKSEEYREYNQGAATTLIDRLKQTTSPIRATTDPQFKDLVDWHAFHDWLVNSQASYNGQPAYPIDPTTNQASEKPNMEAIAAILSDLRDKTAGKQVGYAEAVNNVIEQANRRLSLNIKPSNGAPVAKNDAAKNPDGTPVKPGEENAKGTMVNVKVDQSAADSVNGTSNSQQGQQAAPVSTETAKAVKTKLTFLDGDQPLESADTLPIKRYRVPKKGSPVHFLPNAATTINY